VSDAICNVDDIAGEQAIESFEIWQGKYWNVLGGIRAAFRRFKHARSEVQLGRRLTVPRS
jgi:hypothetical protein